MHSEQLLENGFSVKTFFGGMVTVEKFIAEGGQGWVYVVNYNGQKKALKWYKKTCLVEKPNAFYENIKQNIMRGSPSPEFLWPLDITEWEDGTFGYIMDLRPEGYFGLADYMLGYVAFESFYQVIDAAIQIVSAFIVLHNAGYSCQHLDDGNFFINPTNGKVYVCCNDYAVPEGTQNDIMGKLRYMAPEIVMKRNKPNSLSDRFSMSVILYILFCLNHPLEGIKYLAPFFLTSELQEKLYGSEPCFIMDPIDKSNGPHPTVHKKTIIIWSYLPDYIKKIFCVAFSEKSFQKPSARPKEIDWLKAFTRFRSDIVNCSCGNQIFTQQGEVCKCEVCNKKADITFKLVLSDYAIPAVKDSRIYRCQLGVCNEKEALSPIAQVVQNQDTSELELKNISGRIWDAITPTGKAIKIYNNEVVPLDDKFIFKIDNENIKVERNKGVEMTMPVREKLDETPCKELHVFYVLDTSSSMNGEKINELNNSMEEQIELFKEFEKTECDIKIKIFIMEFNTSCRWITYNDPEDLQNFEYPYLKAKGEKNLGVALSELNEKLSRNKFLKSSQNSFLRPVIIFMTDSCFKDSETNHFKGLEELRKNRWFKYSAKWGILVGGNPNIEMISSIVGNSEAVIETKDVKFFKKMFEIKDMPLDMIADRIYEKEDINFCNYDSSADWEDFDDDLYVW